MKQTQRKDALRNILRQKVSYISIIVIAMLAVTAYLGISFSANALYAQADRYYSRMHYRDAEVISTLLVTDDDLAAIRAQKGIADAEGVYTTDGKIEQTAGRQSVSIVSLTERVNTPELTEGRMPASANECLLERELAEQLGLGVGDRIRITGNEQDAPQYLKENEFTITGLALHPDLYGMPVVHVGNRYVLVRSEAFDREALDGGYMKAEVAYARPEGASMFDREYETLAAEEAAQLEAIQAERTAARDREVRDAYETRIAEGQDELDRAKAELDDARRTLDEKTAELHDGEQAIRENEQLLADAKRQLDDAKKQLEDAERELADAEKQLEDAKRELDAAKEELDAGKAQLDSAKRRLNKAKTELTETYQTIEDGKQEIRSRLKNAIAKVCGAEFADSIRWAGPSTPNIDDPNTTATNFAIAEGVSIDLSNSPDTIISNGIRRILGGTEFEDKAQEVLSELTGSATYQQLNDAYDRIRSGLLKWDEGHKTYLDAKKKYRRAESQYNAGLSQYQAGVAEYEAGLLAYEEGRKAYEEGLSAYNENLLKYEEGLTALEDAKKQLEEGRAKLLDGEAQYADGVKQYEDGLKTLADARTQLADLAPCRWVILTADGNAGFLSAKNTAKNVSRIGMTFSLLFILVGALVIYATAGRMIEEQRRLVGTTKSLGFFNREVLTKYLTFGLSATLLGVLLGVLFGYFAIEKIVLVAHQSFYVDGVIPRSFRPIPTLIITMIGAALSGLSVWIACAAMVRAPARELMQERVPPARKTRSGVKTGLPLYTRLILRNAVSDKKRVLITVVSIAGCCTLLMIGFTMYHGITTAITRQFDDIMRYEQEIRFDPSVSATAKDEIKAVLDERNLQSAEVLSQNLMVSTGTEKELLHILTGRPEELLRFYDLRDAETGEPIVPDGQGLLIHKRYAEKNRLKAGDAITIYDAGMAPHATTVSGVYNSYFSRDMFLSEDGYRAIIGEEPLYNALWINDTGDPEALKAALCPIAGYEGIDTLDRMRDSANNVAKILTLITGVLIVCAGLMAYFILLNLTGMYLVQKKRELTIMRINGFTTKEVIRYVSREMLFTSALGILLGVGVGMLFGYVVLRLLEQTHIQFVRSVSWVAVLLSAALTAVFSACINAIALRNVRNLKLTDL